MEAEAGTIVVRAVNGEDSVEEGVIEEATVVVVVRTGMLAEVSDHRERITGIGMVQVIEEVVTLDQQVMIVTAAVVGIVMMIVATEDVGHQEGHEVKDVVEGVVLTVVGEALMGEVTALLAKTIKEVNLLTLVF